MRFAGTALLLSCVLLAGCRGATRPLEEDLRGATPEPPPPAPYVAGDVIVGFHDGVSESQADAMFVSHGLRWESGFSRNFACWVEVESGDPNAHVVRLSSSPLVSWAERRGNPFSSTRAVSIIVFFKATATQETARALVASVPGLRVHTMVLPPQYGVAAVAPGSEHAWIAVLSREPIVEYASVNWIAWTQPQ